MLGTKAVACAKINLFLDVGKRQSDGFHEIWSLMQSLDLEDELYFRRIPDEEGQIYIRSSDSQVPCDETNLAWRATALFAERTGGFGGEGVEVTLHKKIPVAAGLGGGSADAAATLIALSAMWERGLSAEELKEIGAEVGSDVPFCLTGGTAWVTGRGEVVQPLKELPSPYVVIASPGTPVSTREVYERFDGEGKSLPEPEREVHIESILESVYQGDAEATFAHLHNSLESATISRDIVEEYKETALRAGASSALMTGSGPTVFALTLSLEVATTVASALGEIAPLTILTRFSDKGARLSG